MTYLGQDEYAGGYLGGLKLAADGGTNGVCINQQVGHTGLDKRCAGFVAAMEENGILARYWESVMILPSPRPSSPTTIRPIPKPTSL